MSRWFRYYDDALNDPKVQKLSGDMFKAWVNLLCLASRTGGELTSLADVAFALRVPEPKAAVIITALATNGLLDKVEGRYFAPHNWGSRQYKTDVTDPTNAERQKRHRNGKRNAETVTPIVTPKRPEQSRAETEQSRADGARSDQHVVNAKIEIVRIFEAAGQLPPDTGYVEVWDAQKYDLKLCVAVIGARVRPGKTIGKLSFFDEAIREAHEKRNPAPTAKPAIVWDTIVTIWAKGVPENDAFWPPRLGPSPGESGCRCPPEILRKHGVDPATGKLVETAA